MAGECRERGGAISGATSPTLTLGNLQLTNAGAYSLQASNAAGVSVSSSATLVVNPAPVPDANGIVIIPANQSGPSPFTPTWTVVQANSLIYGWVPTTASGTFNLNDPRAGVNGLTTNIDLTVSDVGGVQDPNYVATCGNGYSSGSQIIYALTNSVSGYNLTNITVYSGWDDSGRNAQAYAVYYASAANPTNFIYLTAVNYAPSVAVNPPMANQVVISNASGGADRRECLRLGTSVFLSALGGRSEWLFGLRGHHGGWGGGGGYGRDEPHCNEFFLPVRPQPVYAVVDGGNAQPDPWAGAQHCHRHVHGFGLRRHAGLD